MARYSAYERLSVCLAFSFVSKLAANNFSCEVYSGLYIVLFVVQNEGGKLKTEVGFAGAYVRLRVAESALIPLMRWTVNCREVSINISFIANVASDLSTAFA